MYFLELNSAFQQNPFNLKTGPNTNYIKINAKIRIDKDNGR